MNQRKNACIIKNFSLRNHDPILFFYFFNAPIHKLLTSEKAFNQADSLTVLYTREKVLIKLQFCK